MLEFFYDGDGSFPESKCHFPKSEAQKCTLQYPSPPVKKPMELWLLSFYIVIFCKFQLAVLLQNLAINISANTSKRIIPLWKSLRQPSPPPPPPTPLRRKKRPALILLDSWYMIRIKRCFGFERSLYVYIRL